MADGVVTVLDALENVHVGSGTPALIWSVNAAGMAGECVKTPPISLPLDASEARVVVNNGYGAGSAIHYRIRLTKVTAINPLTKNESTLVTDWTSVNAGIVSQSAVMDISGIFAGTVHLDIAIVGTTAHLGTEINVQIRKKASVAQWSDWSRFAVLSGVTAFSTALNATSSGSILTVAAIGNLTTAKGFKFLYVQDVADITKSEVVYQISGA
jgi:hypothetical protein